MNEKHVILQKPGAGLPWWELAVARVLFRTKCRFGHASRFVAEFQRECLLIAALLENREENELRMPVLIRRLRGLEDSSRNWSAWMTLEHLRIVHEAMAGVLRALAAGQRPPGQASTAAVKPGRELDASVRQKFEQSCDDLMACVAAISEFRTTITYPHPWFGEMDAHAWLALAAGHMGIHRRQLQAIFRERILPRQEHADMHQ